MSFRFRDRSEEGVLNVVVQLVDALAARWSYKQAVAQHLNRAAWSSVETGLTFFEETVQSILDR